MSSVVARRLPLMPILLLLLLVAAPVLAADPPDAGQILNEQRRAPLVLPQLFPALKEKVQQLQQLTDDSVKVKIRGFAFSGYGDVVSEQELSELVKDAVGRELGLAGLQELAQRVGRFLRDKGYPLARAYLPKQDITHGWVKIVVVVGKVEGVAGVNIKEPHRLDPEILRDLVQAAAPPGEAIRTDDLERAVLLANDLPGITARAELEKGETPGTSRLLIQAEEGPLLAGSLGLHNQGNSYTGKWLGNGLLFINDPFGIGDQISLFQTGSEGLLYGRAAYAFPLGSEGLRAELFYAGMQYDLGEDLKPLGYSGRSDSFGAGVRYPLLRGRLTSLWGALNYEYDALADYSKAGKIKDRALHIGTAELTANHFDTFGGGGTTNLRVAMTVGNFDVSDGGIDASGPRAEGLFYKASYSLSRLQWLYRKLSLFGSVRGQLSGQNLDSSQKFSLGGPTGVRAYPQSEAPGDAGQLYTLELRYDLPARWDSSCQVAAFFDAGHTTLHRHLGATTLSDSDVAANDYWLTGGGLALRLMLSGRYSLEATYAHQIGSNPGLSTRTGRDAENSTDDYRYWLVATYWF